MARQREYAETKALDDARTKLRVCLRQSFGSDLPFLDELMVALDKFVDEKIDAGLLGRRY